MFKRVALIVLALIGLTVACGIPKTGDVSRVADDQLGALADSLPTSTTTTSPAVTTTISPTTTTIALDTTTTLATEDVTLYFISGGILVPFPRTLRLGASSSEVLSALQEGPPASEILVGLRTALPREAQGKLNVKEDNSGVATVDLPMNFYDTIANPEDQPLAIGQIVLTLTEVRRIGQVLFTQGGQPTGVPRGAGDFSQPGVPLPPRDYLELLESPAATTTTTTTTVAVAPPETTV